MGLFSLIARLSMDTSGFELGAKRARGVAKNLGNEISQELKGKLAAAFGAAAIEEAARRTIEYADKIITLGKRLDVSAESLQEFDYAARQNGATIEDVTTFLERLGDAREDALNGNDKLLKSFNALGVSADMLSKSRADDIAKTIGRTLRGGDMQSLIAPLRDVGGRGGGLLGPMLRDFDASAEAARGLGVVIEDSLLKNLKEASDLVTELGARFRAYVAPGVVFLINRVHDLLDGLKLLVGVPTAEIGALIGGASFRDAGKAGADVLREVTNAREARLAARGATESIPSGRTSPNGTGGTLDLFATRAQVTQRQAVGAMVGVGPSSDQVKVLKTLEQIERNTRQDEDGGFRP